MPPIREHILISKNNFELVFWAPLKEDLKDHVNNVSPNVTGSMTTFDSTKGLYFNGSSGLVFPNFSFSGDSTKGLVLLMDFYRTANSGHNTMVDARQSNNAYNFGLMRNSGRSINAIWPSSIDYLKQVNQYDSLNTQYSNAGFYYKPSDSTLNKIINGEIVYTQSVSTFPKTTNLNFRIGMTHYSGDKFRGYLKNVRLYVGDFDQNMLM